MNENAFTNESLNAGGTGRKNTKIIEGYGVTSFAVIRQNARERRITEFLSRQGRNSHVVRDMRMDVSTSFAHIQCTAALNKRKCTAANKQRVISGHWKHGP